MIEAIDNDYKPISKCARFKNFYESSKFYNGSLAIIIGV